VRGLALVFALHVGADQPGDRWFAVDKAKHFFMAAFVQSASFSALRLTGLGRQRSLAGATGVASAVSVGKELYDLRFGGDASFKDLAWDGVGIVAATALLNQTER
jgi:uncharacterized protein YfiM (DUF2279 family)